MKDQKKMVKVLKDMFDHTSYFQADQLTSVLLVREYLYYLTFI